MKEMIGDQNQYQRDHLSFYAPQPIVGYWVLPVSKKGFKTKFARAGKPNWFHRLMMKWVLGWAWEDEK